MLLRWTPRRITAKMTNWTRLSTAWPLLSIPRRRLGRASQAIVIRRKNSAKWNSIGPFTSSTLTASHAAQPIDKRARKLILLGEEPGEPVQRGREFGGIEIREGLGQ